MSYSVADFEPVLTKFHRDDPRLQYLDRDELISVLPESMQHEIRRAEWAWANIEELAGEEVLDPLTNEPIKDRKLSREDILLLFDPSYIEVPSMSEEDNLLAYAASDSVMWSRVNLKMNPRLYQILIMRNPNTRVVLRLGRRCGKTATFAMKMLHASLTQPGHKSLVIAPMKTHCEVIWQMIKDALRRNPDFAKMLQDRDIRHIEAPNYQMTFPNGSKITMFTSGVRSKNKADNVRGQEADDIYLDEVDLMSSDDLPAFTAILRDTGRGEKTMTIASTPNGRRDMMYRFSTEFRKANLPDGTPNKRPYVEYYFPTHADVNYTRADDAEQKTLLTRNQYQHEILAIYGEETSGVFLKQHLDRAQNHYPDGYEYLDINDIYHPEENTKLIVGVDWDKYGAGVNVILCAANYNTRKPNEPDRGRLKVVARWEVPRSSDTLTRATDFVKTLNAVYKPDAIYIDRGYGDMQYEELQLAARDALKDGGDRRCIGLEKVLRGVHFAESVEVYDPFSNERIKKDVKDYMVTMTIKMFEDDQIVLNPMDYDSVSGPTDMIKQFEGYQIVRRSITGKPVYEAASTSVGDHALDAFMLCVMAMHQEWGSFSRPEQHAAPVSIAFNIFDVVGDTKFDMGKHDQEQPMGSFQLRRTNVKGGKMTYAGGRRLKRRGI